MPDLKIDTGEVRLTINDDPERVIAFNPSDVVFAENFQNLRFEVTHKLEEYQKKANELANLPESADEDVIAEREKALIALRYAAIDFLRAKIDAVFGQGTSQTAFGDLKSEQAIGSFLEGVAPFVQVVRQEKLAKYVQPPVVTKRKKHAVMK